MADDAKLCDSDMNMTENGAVFHDTQLSYIGQDCDYIPKHLADAHGALVKRLDLSFNCLRNVNGVENFPNLEELILDNNQLSDDLTFPYFPYIHTLTLNKNQITDLYGLLPKLSENLPSLIYLSLLGNEACPNQLSSTDKDDEDYQRYRYYVLYQLPKLKFLDSSAVTNEEQSEAQRRGPFLKVIRPDTDTIDRSPEAEKSSESEGPYTPLPSQLREDGDHAATFGKCKYVYYGRHSEGNRFIRNNDL